MQVSIDGDNIWLIGVPRVGDMPRLERELRRLGIRVDAMSWRGGNLAGSPCGTS